VTLVGCSVDAGAAASSAAAGGTTRDFDEVGVARGLDGVGSARALDGVGSTADFDTVCVGRGLDGVGPTRDFDGGGVARDFGGVGLARVVASAGALGGRVASSFGSSRPRNRGGGTVLAAFDGPAAAPSGFGCRAPPDGFEERSRGAGVFDATNFFAPRVGHTSGTVDRGSPGAHLSSHSVTSGARPQPVMLD